MAKKSPLLTSEQQILLNRVRDYFAQLGYCEGKSRSDRWLEYSKRSGFVYYYNPLTGEVRQTARRGQRTMPFLDRDSLCTLLGICAVTTKRLVI